jgi:hypothetical protein
MGGRVSIDGIAGNNYQSVARYGLTLSIPLEKGLSAQANWGSWLSAQNSGRYNAFGLTLQYRWFDP